MRIAYFSPFRPASTGIADYSEEIVPHLADHVDLDLFVDGYEPSNPRIRDCFPVYDAAEFEERHRQHPYDVPLYQMGNNACHLYIYRLLQKYPGVVVLHDSILHHFLSGSLLHGEHDYAGYQEAFGEQGQSLMRRQLSGVWSDVDHFAFPGVARVVDRSRAIVVHSQATAQQLRQAFPGTPVHVVRQHIGPDCSPFQGLAAAEVKARVGLRPDSFVVASFGFIVPSKRFDSTLLAYRELLKTHPNSEYLVVGAENSHYDLRKLVREAELEGLVHIVGSVPMEMFYGLMDASDVCVQLRYPSAGETSAAVLRVMSKGKPVVLSNYAQFAEFPDDCCLKVDLGPAEVPMLTDYLRLLADDRSFCRQVGENARRYVRTYNNVEQTVQGYLQALQEVAAMGPGDPLGGGVQVSQAEEEWLDASELAATIRREVAGQVEEGRLEPPERDRYQAMVSDWIVEEVRRALAERWHAGELIGPDMVRYQTVQEPPEELVQGLKELQARWKQPYTPIEVKGGPPLVGGLWAEMRRRVHEEVRSYLEPLIWNQNEVNAAVVHSLNALTNGLYKSSLQHSLQLLQQEVLELRRQLHDLQSRAPAPEPDGSGGEKT